MARSHSKYRTAPLPPLAPVIALAREERSPPSSDLINVILEYADAQADIGGGRTILRLSARRMKDPVIRGILGRETRRLADVSLIWDEEEGVIIRVIDEAAEADQGGAIEAASELDTFELTEAALAYVALHRSRGRG